MSNRPIGADLQAFSVQARDKEIMARAQDGGAVTALLASLLDAGFIDGALVTKAGDSPWLPVPVIVTKREELLKCAGTKYSRASIFAGLRGPELGTLQRVAVVGLPCQVQAVRRVLASKSGAQELGSRIKLIIGLFCMHAFPYREVFKQLIEEKLGTPLAEVTKFDIKHRRFLVYRGEKVAHELELDLLEQFVDVSCKICEDFTAELADISVGAVGSPPKHSTVFLQTQVGAEAFELARERGAFDVRPLEEVKPGMAIIEKLSLKKKRLAAEEITRRREGGTPPGPA